MLHKLTDNVHEYLNIGQIPRAADCIFVHAGRPERKRYGLHLFRQGYAKSIVFSVGRFEWRRFSELGLEDEGGLIGMVHQTPPRERHYFVHIRQGAAHCSLIEKCLLGTLQEATALSRFVEQEGIRSLIVLSSGFHLRRAVGAVKHCCSRLEPDIIPVAVPSAFNQSTDLEGPKAKESAGAIAAEFVKHLLYRLVFLLRIPVC